MRSQQQEIAFAQRYFEKSYNIETVPTSITPIGQLEYVVVIPLQQTQSGFGQTFSTPKRITPTIIWFSPVSGAINRIFDTLGPADILATPVNPGETTTGSIVTVPLTEGAVLEGHYTANARMTL